MWKRKFSDDGAGENEELPRWKAKKRISVSQLIAGAKAVPKGSETDYEPEDDEPKIGGPPELESLQNNR